MTDEALTETFFAIHKTLFTTPRIKDYLREFEDAYHVVIVYTPSETLPSIGHVVSTSMPDREHAEPFDVKVVEVIMQAPVRGEAALMSGGMACNLVIGRIGPESFPYNVSNPDPTPTVDGTTITRDVGWKGGLVLALVALIFFYACLILLLGRLL